MRGIWILVLGITLTMAGMAAAGEMEGTIQSIDTASKEVVLDNGSRIAVEDATTITVNGAEAKLEDLKEGTRVKASFEEKDGRMVADTLDVAAD